MDPHQFPDNPPETPEEKNERLAREEIELKKFYAVETGKPASLTSYKINHPDADPDKRFIRRDDADAYLQALRDAAVRKQKGI